jgi:hypothetical protein
VNVEVDMSAQDDGTGQERPRDDQPLDLPGVTSAVARSVRYDRPRRFVADGEEHAEHDVVEIDVVTDAEIYIGGTGPALFVGDVPLIDSERVAERTYRFFAPASVRLEQGAPISLGRAGTGVPTPERRTELRLEWHAGDQATE